MVQIDFSQKMAAGIVLFNPDDLERLEKSVQSVLKQIKRVYIFDNSTKKYNIDFLKNVTYMSENANRGIAYALNRIMEQAKCDGYAWVVTMDQDSILPNGIVRDYVEHLKLAQIGIICPQVVDRRRTYMEIDDNDNNEYIDMCITSASCTSIEAWEKIGRYDDKLFIDLVDNDFCKRLIISGYKILRLNKWVLDQEFGKIIPKSPRIQQFWVKVSKILHNKNLAKFSYKKSVSPMRVYFTCRNIIYLNKKLKKYGPTAYENYNCNSYLGFIVSFIVPSFLRADQKMKVLKAIITGTYDGLKMKVQPWYR